MTIQSFQPTTWENLKIGQVVLFQPARKHLQSLGPQQKTIRDMRSVSATHKEVTFTDGTTRVMNINDSWNVLR